jgi:hypothetical protein
MKRKSGIPTGNAGEYFVKGERKWKSHGFLKLAAIEKQEARWNELLG